MNRVEIEKLIGKAKIVKIKYKTNKEIITNVSDIDYYISCMAVSETLKEVYPKVYIVNDDIDSIKPFLKKAGIIE